MTAGPRFADRTQSRARLLRVAHQSLPHTSLRSKSKAATSASTCPRVRGPGLARRSETPYSVPQTHTLFPLCIGRPKDKGGSGFGGSGCAFSRACAMCRAHCPLRPGVSRPGLSLFFRLTVRQDNTPDDWRRAPREQPPGGGSGPGFGGCVAKGVAFSLRCRGGRRCPRLTLHPLSHAADLLSPPVAARVSSPRRGT